MPKQEDTIVLGLMSGSSVDGLDCAIVSFNTLHHWRLLASETLPFPQNILEGLKRAPLLSGFELAKLSHDFGYWVAIASRQWWQKTNTPKPNLVSSHGHTIFHEPKMGFSTQIGNPAVIAANWQLRVAYDFRSLDLATGGQGAPLVPIGDIALFPNYHAWLNLGGIANLTCRNENGVMACDVTACNQIMNLLAQKMGHSFDFNGTIGLSGSVNKQLLEQLNSISFMTIDAPKSLSNQNVTHFFWPLFENTNISVPDKMATLANHVAFQVKSFLPKTHLDNNKMLITGGGAFNKCLLFHLNLYNISFVVPDKTIIEAKEAIIFAYLGFLLLNKIPNVLHQVTGGAPNLVSGSICGLGF